VPRKTFSEILNQTKRQTRWWAYAAWTMPFVALALLGAEVFFGYNDLFRKTLVAVGVTFFSVSVFWWWWAIFKIRDMVNGLDRTINSLSEVKDEIIKTRKVLEDSTSWEKDDSSR
jgi:hypothetical protein